LTIVDNLYMFAAELPRSEGDMRRRGVAFLLALLGVSGPSLSLEPLYRVTGHIRVPDARWDYGAVDPAERRLYLGRFGGVLALDLNSNVVTAVLVPSALVHGVLPLGHGLVMSTNGQADTVSLFEGLTGRQLATIPTGKDPDAIVREPRTGLVVTTNAGSRDLSLIDPAARRGVATIALPGAPEFPAAGPNGLLYDNIEDKNEIAVIDLAAQRIVRTYALRRCQSPTGLAYDATDDLLLAVCKNGVAVFLHGSDGHELANVDVGAGPDAAVFDETRHRAFVPAGGPGWLTVFSVRAAAVTKIQTLATSPGSRTSVLDPSTGNLYVPAALFRPARDPTARPTPVPGTFEILVIEPTTVRPHAQPPAPSQRR
jgi:DNA-binding beta-propeller fold protein YncE